MKQYQFKWREQGSGINTDVVEANDLHDALQKLGDAHVGVGTHWLWIINATNEKDQQLLQVFGRLDELLDKHVNDSIVDDSIAHRDGKWYVKMEKTGELRPKAGYKTKEEAMKLLKAIEIHKHAHDSEKCNLITLVDKFNNDYETDRKELTEDGKPEVMAVVTGSNATVIYCEGFDEELADDLAFELKAKGFKPVKTNKFWLDIDDKLHLDRTKFITKDTIEEGLQEKQPYKTCWIIINKNRKDEPYSIYIPQINYSKGYFATIAEAKLEIERYLRKRKKEKSFMEDSMTTWATNAQMNDFESKLIEEKIPYDYNPKIAKDGTLFYVWRFDNTKDEDRAKMIAAGLGMTIELEPVVDKDGYRNYSLKWMNEHHYQNLGKGLSVFKHEDGRFSINPNVADERFKTVEDLENFYQRKGFLDSIKTNDALNLSNASSVAQKLQSKGIMNAIVYVADGNLQIEMQKENMPEDVVGILMSISKGHAIAFTKNSDGSMKATITLTQKAKDALNKVTKDQTFKFTHDETFADFMKEATATGFNPIQIDVLTAKVVFVGEDANDLLKQEQDITNIVKKEHNKDLELDLLKQDANSTITRDDLTQIVLAIQNAADKIENDYNNTEDDDYELDVEDGWHNDADDELPKMTVERLAFDETNTDTFIRDGNTCIVKDVPSLMDIHLAHDIKDYTKQKLVEPEEGTRNDIGSYDPPEDEEQEYEDANMFIDDVTHDATTSLMYLIGKIKIPGFTATIKGKDAIFEKAVVSPAA